MFGFTDHSALRIALEWSGPVNGHSGIVINNDIWISVTWMCIFNRVWIGNIALCRSLLSSARQETISERAISQTRNGFPFYCRLMSHSGNHSVPPCYILTKYGSFFFLNFNNERKPVENSLHEIRWKPFVLMLWRIIVIFLIVCHQFHCKPS